MRSLVLVRHLPVTPASPPVWVGGGANPDADRDARFTAWEGLDALRNAWPPDAVLCSPLRRAQQTAAVVDLPVRTDVRLVERHFGPWEGRPVDECMAGVPAWATADTAAWLAYDTGGETFADVEARVDAVWADIRATDDACVWCVSHAGPLAILRARACGMPVEDMFDDALPRGGWMVIDRDAGREVGRGATLPGAGGETP